ncbi:MAG: rhomboid family intramembrane serine protease [Eubacterium sp.]|nr:rhomboid family intramembrane serine protease [Eubacterium sp.]
MRTGTLEDTQWEETPDQPMQVKRPIINIILVVINVAVWCVLEIIGDTQDAGLILRYGGMYPDLLLAGEWYRLFTAMFLHFGAEHLANNMILLAAAGGKLEAAAGSFRYLMIYLGSGVAGNLLSFYIRLQTGDYAVSAGASGAVFGMIGGLVWVAVRNKGKFEGLTTKGLLFMIALCMYYGVTTAGIDNWAHAGGAAGGLLLCILLYRKSRSA